MTLFETNESSGESGSNGCLNANSSQCTRSRGPEPRCPRSPMKSYKIKSKNLTFSLTRGPGAGSATITNGLMGQIEMKVVNEAHVKISQIREREGSETREREEEK